jgi:hypothetical protein
MKLAVLESPLGGRYIKVNTLYARHCQRQLLLAGYAPFASHLLYPQSLDDHDTDERLLGMKAGRQLSIHMLNSLADHVFFIDLGVTDGMATAFAYSSPSQQRFAHNFERSYWTNVRAMMDTDVKPDSVFAAAMCIPGVAGLASGLAR